MQGVAAVFPGVRASRAIGTYAGVRPTLYAYGPNEDALSREHEVVDHAADGAPGHLLDDRRQAGELPPLRAGALRPRGAARLRLHVPARRTRAPSSRAATGADAIALAGRTGDAGRRRGGWCTGTATRAARVLERAARRPPRSARRLPVRARARGRGAPRLREEMARTVDDVARRTRLGLGACGGMRCAARCGQIVAEERWLSRPRAGPDAWRASSWMRQAQTRIVAMGPEQARQEALALAHVRASLGESRERRQAPRRRHRRGVAGTGAALAASARSAARVTLLDGGTGRVDARDGRPRPDAMAAPGRSPLRRTGDAGPLAACCA